MSAARFPVIAAALLFLASVLNVGATISKNRVGNFFESVPLVTASVPSQVLDTSLENWSLYDGTVSGRPFGFVDGPNLYAYVQQNPWSKFDPEGLSDQDVGVVVFGTYVGLGGVHKASAYESGRLPNIDFQNIKAAASNPGGFAKGLVNSVVGTDLGKGEAGVKEGQTVGENLQAVSAVGFRGGGKGAPAKAPNEVTPAPPSGGKAETPTQTALQTKSQATAEVEQVAPGSLVSRQGPSEMTGNKVKRFAKDMKENGYDQTKPIEVAEVDGRNIIIDGHHRTEAARKAGIPTVPITKTQVSPARAEKLSQEAAEAAAERESRRR